MLSRPASVLLIPALILACPAPVFAGAPAEEQASEVEAPAEGEAAVEDEVPVEDEGPAEDTELDQAQELFNSGADKFETADYAGAIEDWTEAYGLVPNLPDYGGIKAKLIANIASAQEKAYEVDKEPSHLNQAKILLERYRDEIPEIYPTPAEREKELAWVDEHVAEIDAELDALAQAEADAEARRNAALAAKDAKPPGRTLIIAGSTFTGLGVAGLGTFAAGLALGGGAEDISDLPTNETDARGERYARGRLGNTLAYVGGISGGVLLVTGVALLAVGLKQRKAGAAQSEQAPSVTLAPMLGRERAGLALSGRF